MTTMNKLGSILGLAAALALGACETTNAPGSGTAYPQSTYPQSTYPQSTYPQSTSTGGIYSGYGVVQSIEPVAQAQQASTGIGGTGIGIGTIAGAVIGGVVGSQVGSGRGNTAATVVGAAGGAYAGHEIEKRTQQQQQQPTTFNVTIRMDNGSYQTLTQSSVGDIRVGDRVQIDNGVVRRY